MRLAAELRRFAMRMDVRLALFVGGAAFAFASLLLAGLLAYATLEALEDQARELREEAAGIRAQLERGEGQGAVLSRNPAVGWRVIDPSGLPLAVGGMAWSDRGRSFEQPSLRAALGSGAADRLSRREAIAGGRTVETSLSLGPFVRERRELAGRAFGVVMLGAGGAFLIGVFGARRALAPVRAATAAVRRVDPHRLDARIPTRGVQDDVDALAVAINDVLARIEWAFGRLSGFGADVAHELRTPINRLLNTAEVALLEGQDRGVREDALLCVRATAEQMQRTVEQLLLLARGEEGRLPLARAPTSLATLLGSLVELYAPMAEAAGQTLVLRADACVASVDRALLERALVNLLENALRHTPAGGVIHVLARASGDRVVLGIEDSGPGIAAEDRARIFERFVRLDPARAAGGTGLGLAIARLIVRLHGGELVAEASALGGAAFRLWLPCADVAPGPERAAT
jgi:two-component system heavy metal sensor histidine kinase CusS